MRIYCDISDLEVCGLQAIPEKHQMWAFPPGVELNILENIKVNKNSILFSKPDYQSEHKTKTYETILIILHGSLHIKEQKLVGYSLNQHLIRVYFTTTISNTNM